MATTLITGGSGFLGRGLMHYMNDRDYIVYSRDEYKQDLCKRMFPRAKYVLGDIKDYDRLVHAIKANSVDTIIHTAAIKYIPEAEVNPAECVSVNVDGSRNVALAALYTDVHRIVGVSTDKAVEPINVYGMSKAIMERIFVDSCFGSTAFTLARYGNVVGSTGSVIPLFLRQLKTTGTITITDPDMTRFWISIERAVQLVELALEAQAGDIIIPIASAMRMHDLALALTKDNPSLVKIIGPRAGEKQHEKMLHQYESARSIDMNGHYVLKPTGSPNVSEPFVLSSGYPQVWLNADTMREYIEQALALNV